MAGESRRRKQLDTLKRAGLDYIDRSRLKANAKRTKAPPSPSSDQTEASRETAALLPPDPPLVAADASPLPRERKVAALKVLAQEVAACEKCSILCQSRTQTVFSDGDAAAELCFVGEAPGADEDAQGVPFVGKAGQLLTRIIEACKLKREEVYICNCLKCRPPDNRNPLPDEIANCRPFLDQQLAILKPRMMVALGKFAAAHLLRKRPEEVAITRIRGQIHEYAGIPFMITLHPAYLLRNPSAKADVWNDMKHVMRLLGRPID